MLIGPFRLTALAEWKTIYILKRIAEGENYHYHTMELQQNLPPFGIRRITVEFKNMSLGEGLLLSPVPFILCPVFVI